MSPLTGLGVAGIEEGVGAVDPEVVPEVVLKEEVVEPGRATRLPPFEGSFGCPDESREQDFGGRGGGGEWWLRRRRGGLGGPNTASRLPRPEDTAGPRNDRGCGAKRASQS